MKTRVDEYNGKFMGRVSIGKFWRFSSNEYWKNISCLISEPTFGVGWSNTIGEGGCKYKRK